MPKVDLKLQRGTVVRLSPSTTCALTEPSVGQVGAMLVQGTRAMHLDPLELARLVSAYTRFRGTESRGDGSGAADPTTEEGGT